MHIVRFMLQYVSKHVEWAGIRHVDGVASITFTKHGTGRKKRKEGQHFLNGDMKIQ